PAVTVEIEKGREHPAAVGIGNAVFFRAIDKVQIALIDKKRVGSRRKDPAVQVVVPRHQVSAEAFVLRGMVAVVNKPGDVNIRQTVAVYVGEGNAGVPVSV